MESRASFKKVCHLNKNDDKVDIKMLIITKEEKVKPGVTWCFEM